MRSATADRSVPPRGTGWFGLSFPTATVPVVVVVAVVGCGFPRGRNSVCFPNPVPLRRTGVGY